jgi:hypothetical protein
MNEEKKLWLKIGFSKKKVRVKERNTKNCNSEQEKIKRNWKREL